MSIELINDKGTVTIAKSVIAEMAGGAAVECYGVVGMVSKKMFRDGINELLNKENYSKGVEVSQGDKDALRIDIFIVVAYGIKISEIAVEVQKKVKYILESALDMEVNEVNVNIQDIKVI